MIKAYVIVHLLCAVLTFGMWTAEFQGEFPDLAKKDCREDMGTGMLIGLATGPIGAFTMFFITGFAQHGLQFTCESK